MINRSKICKAFIEKKNCRCTKKPIIGTNYCWYHYPKKEPIIILFIGAILGMVLPLLLNEPLKDFLSQVKPFSYLDNKPPTIIKITPDFDESYYYDNDIDSMKIKYFENGSGLNIKKSSFQIKLRKGDSYIPIKCNLNHKKNELSINVINNLKFGEYFIQVELVDNSNNIFRLNKSFYIAEKQDFDVMIKRKKYDIKRHKNIFSEFINRREKMLDRYDLYIYQLIFFNHSEYLNIKSMYLYISTGLCAFKWLTIGGMNYKDVEYSNFTEAMDNRLLNGEPSIFSSEYVLKLAELAPGGILEFLILLGNPIIQPKNSPGLLPDDIHIAGTYIREGYGKSEIVKINKWVGIK